MKIMPQERFYLWIKSNTYGWSAIGNWAGYESVKELQRENDFYFRTKDEKEIMIMRATPFKQTKQKVKVKPIIGELK